MSKDGYTMLPPTELMLTGRDEEAKLRIEYERRVDGWIITKETIADEAS